MLLVHLDVTVKSFYAFLYLLTLRFHRIEINGAFRSKIFRFRPAQKTESVLAVRFIKN